MPLGVYISVPFCRSKCSYCNFASGVFSRALMTRYVDRVCADIAGAEELASSLGAEFERTVDSVYFGGGTPTALEPAELARLFAHLSDNFEVLEGAEVTVECAPGSLTPDMLDTLVGCGVNRVSLGVQSFVDQEAAAVGRLHTRAQVLDDIARLRVAGISELNLDLIAGLPHQTRESWMYSLAEAMATEVPHVSVYMLEVDEDSRLGRELMAGGTRYHAHFVPDEDLTADLYLEACGTLERAGIAQYEISNYARPGHESRHNLKYWTRQPYLGFGLDAHSMLRAGARLAESGAEGFRFATPDGLEGYLGRDPGMAPAITILTPGAALEETFFLGLRLNRGVRLEDARQRFGPEAMEYIDEAVSEFISDGLMSGGERVALTAKGRLLSNEVFARFVSVPGAARRRRIQ